MRRAAVLVLLIAFGALGTGRALADPPAEAATVPLTHGWRLRVGTDAARASSTANWSLVNVPSVFDSRPTARLYDGTVGTYDLRFRAPVTAPGQFWAIHFERVHRIAHVYVNGKLLAVNTDPYSAFDVAARNLRPGRLNDLRVVVDNRRPAGRRDPWWNWGGIDRPVSLEARGPVHVENASVRPIEAGGGWTVEVGGTLVNDTATTQTAALHGALTTPDGTASASDITQTLAPHRRVSYAFAIPVTGSPWLWSPADPSLYAARVTVTAGGVTAEQDDYQVGLRTLAVQDGTLYLNGQRMVLRGAGIMEDVPGHGDALSDADIDAYVTELKALGANVTRAHYALDQRLLDKLDQAGILVWNEAPVIHADTKLRTKAGRAAALDTLRETILATRNHPSVVADAVANELSTGVSSEPGASAYLKAAVQVVHGLDPGRPTALDILAYPGYATQSDYGLFDLLGINAYFGWYPGRQGNPLPGVDRLGAFLEETHQRYPAQALVVTEFGAEAFHHGSAKKKGTYEFQSGYLRSVLQAVSAEPFMQGAIYWTLRDFAVKPDWTGGPLPPSSPGNTIFHKGLLDYHGTEKPAFATAKSLLAQWGQQVGEP